MYGTLHISQHHSPPTRSPTPSLSLQSRRCILSRSLALPPRSARTRHTFRSKSAGHSSAILSPPPTPTPSAKGRPSNRQTRSLSHRRTPAKRDEHMNATTPHVRRQNKKTKTSTQLFFHTNSFQAPLLPPKKSTVCSPGALRQTVVETVRWTPPSLPDPFRCPETCLRTVFAATPASAAEILRPSHCPPDDFECTPEGNTFATATLCFPRLPGCPSPC